MKWSILLQIRILYIFVEDGTLVGSFVVFLEDSGRIATPEKFEDNLHLLELFLEQLTKEGYAPNSLKPYWYECRHFIVWLHQCRISRNDIDVDVLERFFSHDCICLIPGVARRTLNQGDMTPKALQQNQAICGISGGSMCG